MQRMRIRTSVRMFGSLGLMLWLCTLAALAAQHKELAKRVDAILSRPDVARGFWGVEVEELDTGRVVYSHDADKLLTPASNTKLFTTAAALALIGPDYRFRTTAESATGPDKYGRLSGDLVLVGRGDPNLSGRTLPLQPEDRATSFSRARPRGACRSGRSPWRKGNRRRHRRRRQLLRL